MLGEAERSPLVRGVFRFSTDREGLKAALDAIATEITRGSDYEIDTSI